MMMMMMWYTINSLHRNATCIDTYHRETHIHTCTHTHIHMHTHRTHAHTHVHAHTNMHTHTHYSVPTSTPPGRLMEERFNIESSLDPVSTLHRLWPTLYTNTGKLTIQNGCIHALHNT